MATITADDIRLLAKSEHPDAVIAVADGSVVVGPSDGTGVIVYTRPTLLADYGDEITDIDAEVLAAGLTAQTSEN